MKLNDFPLLTDENIDPNVVAYLRQRKFDVFDIKEAGCSHLLTWKLSGSVTKVEELL